MAERVKLDATESGWHRIQQQAKWNNHLLWLAPLVWIVNTGFLVSIDLAGVGKLQPQTVSVVVYLAAILLLLGVMRWQYTRLRVAAATVVRELQAKIPAPDPPALIFTRPEA